MLYLCKKMYVVNVYMLCYVRTLQQWEQGISAPPEYLVRMMAYILLLEETGSIKGEELIGEKREDDK